MLRSQRMTYDRVNESIKSRGKSKLKTADAWCKHLEKNLQFPFAAEIIDEPGPLEVGDIIKIMEESMAISKKRENRGLGLLFLEQRDSTAPPLSHEFVNSYIELRETREFLNSMKLQRRGL